MLSFIRRVLSAYKRNSDMLSSRRRREKKTAISTRQWLILTFSISVAVGLLFILTVLYYQPGK